MKYSCILIDIIDVNESSIVYTSKTDPVSTHFTHICPAYNNFPYNQIQKNKEYGLIAVKLNKTWYWWKLWSLNKNNKLEDQELTDHLIDEYTKGNV